GDGVSGPYLAYRALAQGKLPEAIKLASGSRQIEPDISLLVAASDGASRDLMAKVLDTKLAEDLPAANAWYLFGLAARNGRDTSPFRNVMIKSAPENEQLIKQFEGIVRGKPDRFETYLLGLPISQRGYAYAAAVIILGDGAPPEWRENARRLLFAP